jgi:two-component system, chemotaxis family, sensor kinase CheA
MSAFEQLKTTFFDEASEGLVNLEAGLTEIRDDTGNDDTVHAIFRAVHSIKGGAGVFGFSELIDFAHVFETVLDAIRHGNLQPTPDVTDVLFMANDTLSDLVGMARSGTAVEPGFGGECRSALEQLMQGAESGPKESETDAAEAGGDFADFSFTPVRFDGADGGEDATVNRRYSIAFRPKADMIKKSIEPQFFFNTLRSLGTLDLAADVQALPGLADLDPERAYLGWTACLETTSPRSDLDAIFAPIAEVCDIDIVDLTAGAEPAPAPAPGLVPQPAAPSPPVAAAPMPTAAMPTASAPPLAVPAPEPEAQMDAVAAAEPPPPAAAPVSAKEARAAAARAAAATTIRVELEKIDRVVNMVGELVIAQAMLGQAIEICRKRPASKVSNILAISCATPAA